jgi:tRNA(fMet)-specific endonuclease VapC
VRQQVVHHFHDSAITAVVAAELYYGAESSAHPMTNRAQVEAFLALFTLLPLDKAAALAYGVIRADRARRGQLIEPHDVLIAALALVARMTVVTHKTREFSRVAGLVVEDWHV